MSSLGPMGERAVSRRPGERCIPVTRTFDVTDQIGVLLLREGVEVPFDSVFALQYVVREVGDDGRPRKIDVVGVGLVPDWAYAAFLSREDPAKSVATTESEGDSMMNGFPDGGPTPAHHLTSMEMPGSMVGSATSTATRLPVMGDEVCYVLGTGPHAGEHRPAKILKIWGTPEPGSIPAVQLAVFIDGSNDVPGWDAAKPLWAASVPYSAEGYQMSWHWPDPDGTIRCLRGY